MPPRDPYAKKYFRLEIDGISPGGFEQAAGLSWETEVLEFQEGGRNDHLVRLPGQARLGKVTLTRGYIGTTDLASWARDAREGQSMRRAVDIVILNDAGEEAARYTLLRAWPSRYETKEFTSQQGHAVESMELSHEGIVKGQTSSAPSPANVAAVFGPVTAALEAAGQRARDAAREARQASDAAEAALQAAAAAAGAGIALAATVEGLAEGGPPPFLPAPPAPPVMASPLDVRFSANAAAPSPPSVGNPPGGVHDAMIQGSPPGNVVPHDSPDSFSEALASGGAPPAPSPPAPEVSLSANAGAGFASTGDRGAAATANGDWSDGVARRQPPGELREPPIQTGSELHF